MTPVDRRTIAYARIAWAKADAALMRDDPTPQALAAEAQAWAAYAQAVTGAELDPAAVVLPLVLP